uniref:AAA+ ATPase domain-containing protein n=1 Tax=Cannabis sativa TaxID=3483 RepID=A0A803PGE8_CANSA
MGQGTPGGLNRQGLPGDRKPDGGDKKEKKFEPAAPPARVGRKQRKQKGPEAAARLPTVTPLTKCKLRLLKLERIKDYLLMEEEFVTNQERLKPQEEKAEEDRSKVDDLRGSPMSVGNLEELIDESHAIVSSSVGPEYYVGILSFVDKDQLEPGCAILMHNKVLSVVGLLQDEVDPMVSVMKVEKAPLESYADIGGLDAQIQEIKEAVELPLTHPELYEDIGIKPPKGVILYGEPGTGKTLLAKAVANSTSATFLRVVGSELIQKYLGDGPKLVRELFRVADDLSPSIVFIDEIDAVGTKRYDAHSGGEREIQRTMLELLNQLDGFDSRGDVKVILATNRIESLDPALLRPGRIDRKIEFPLPDIKTRRRIFQIHTSRMTLADDVNLEEFVMTKDEFSGADIKAICTEAGQCFLRLNPKLSLCRPTHVAGSLPFGAISCSLICFKKHKEIPCSKPAASQQNQKEKIPCSMPVASQQNLKETAGPLIQSRVERPLVLTEPTKVLERLQLEALVSSSEICNVLKDENIQKLICDIDNSSDPEKELDKAMESEMFCAFTDKILSTVNQ